ncbi:hypothetical protein [Streptomyces sp. SID12488]|uniref:hypothetical protein n=1 Tax=Streptomyces sp. SID12488 TaxID=2706040 RepID=UPI0013DBAEE4|nr:hypothetical protein [Streptomyces sp. SID12488]NEA66289.1 hypothetical protein [Streptomyces sp. SID12488]
MVTGVYLGPTDTDMARGVLFERNDPADVVRSALDGTEVIADPKSAQAKANLSLDPATVHAPAAATA